LASSHLKSKEYGRVFVLILYLNESVGQKTETGMKKTKRTYNFGFLCRKKINY
jgi:hypothetical protein